MVQLRLSQHYPAWPQCQIARMEVRAKGVIEVEGVTGVAGVQTGGEAVIVAGVRVVSEAMVVVVTHQSLTSHLVRLIAAKLIESLTVSALWR